MAPHDYTTIQNTLRLRAEFLKAHAAILVDMDLARSEDTPGA